MYIATATGVFEMLYFRKYLSWAMKTQILSENLKARRVRPKRITQLLYSVDKGYSDYVEPNVWFNMMAYTSNSNDGVRSYHEKYH